ncbi:hypothetical protein [Bradyrhizobium sp. AS23.2]|uniref:hypothetical protein n=1 Tax=Bradyrhizobium sp. AS23.2 TaxID=1680155 RepID=UPI00093FE1BC|nr:hypothetical protein [Bradyrhizobium sp. AS23.2]OKO78999.1 hypothetical protein AC629_29465 [Bradyrhizobium sp. NAS80.1]OKO80643.1 hypothetical protein AC630_15340 [Bradyrhizobium sp. AS23.2]
MPFNVGASHTSIATGAAGAVAAAAGAGAADVASEAAFQRQLAALTASSTLAAERDVELRVVSTNLTTIKKVADERVQ